MSTLDNVIIKFRTDNYCSNLRQSLLDIGQEVCDVFNTTGKPNVVVEDAKLLAVLVGHRSVCHLRRKVDQRLNAA